MTNVVRLPVRSRWAWDSRGTNRAVRVSTHDRENVVNLSVWRDDICVGTVRLLPDEVANLVTGLTEGLAEMARPPETPAAPTPDDAARLRELERRLADLESRMAATGRPGAVPAWVQRAKGAVRARWGS